jgi:G3E family GTPase
MTLPPDQPQPIPRYIMIGGFLGAGKTTSIQKFARHLDSQGLRVGLITNDQGAGLVDSALGRSNRFPVEEISGGCFCCRFNSLVDAARHLSEESRPDVFLAEPVGSCTDLVATVSLPLQKIYGAQFIVGPLSVLVDPVRARRIFGLEDCNRTFSENVRYIYRKQLEEAELIIINKTDLVPADDLAALHRFFSSEFPDARIHEISAREGLGLDEWFTATLNTGVAHGEARATRNTLPVRRPDLSRRSPEGEGGS